MTPRPRRNSLAAQVASAAKRSPLPFPDASTGRCAAVAIYTLVAGVLLLRLCLGLAMSLRLLRGSRATGRTPKESRFANRTAWRRR